MIGGAGEASEVGGVSVSVSVRTPLISVRSPISYSGQAASPSARPINDARQALDDFNTQHTLGKLAITRD